MHPSHKISAPFVFFIVFTLTVFTGCSRPPENPAPEEMRPVTASRDEVPDEELRRMAELSDVRVKLRRNKDGTYSYEITGKSAESVIEADKKIDAYVKNLDETKR